MRKSKLSSPQSQLEILELIFWGTSQRKIAEKFGVSAATICRFLRKEGTKELTEKFHSQLMQDCLEHAAQNISSLVQNYQTESDFIKRDHGFRASLKIAELSGIFSRGENDR
ncbi:MAG: Trp family transcriptional regulator [Nitrospirae bacterium]|nr:Trp family transcriptional regulator [Nitrospirota bacterium]MCL5236329.1 Trp family transcriptional regulator [Nitrospirota bacterium]